MKELTITIPVKSFKKFDNPYDSKAMAAKYPFVVNVADIPSEWLEWLSVNPREQKLTTDVGSGCVKQNITVIHNHHMIQYLINIPHLVGRDNNGSVVRHARSYKFTELALTRNIKTIGRFVHNQQ